MFSVDSTVQFLIDKMFWWIFLFATGIKVLLMGAYRSTDFEVHRNWMAITHSLPMSEWYYDKTSEWTLDYPPFFAYFEWMLSKIARHFDPKMLEVTSLNYDSDGTVLFQRLSVICADLVYALGVRKCLQTMKLKMPFHIFAAGILLLCNVGLIFVDHIHFQYNGFLFGILLLSMGYLFEEKYIVSCVLFAALLNFKHIFLYMAPAFGAFYLKFHCAQSKHAVRNFFAILVTGLGCFAISFGPFYRHLPQVFSRLFPFKRGLTHAYWAPNFWVLYNLGDKVAEMVLKVPKQGHSNTGGLVQEHAHTVLPKISPLVTFALTGVFMVPCVIKLLFFTDKSESARSFLRTVILCACTAFIFGWHVHEKAILMVIIPLSLLGLTNVQDARYAFILSVPAYFSLFPLLFPVELILVKYSLFMAYISSMYALLKSVHKSLSFFWYEILYFLGFVTLPTYEYIVSNYLGLNEKLPFLPLLLTSFYCSLGVLYTYFVYYYLYMNQYVSTRTKTKVKTK